MSKYPIRPARRMGEVVMKIPFDAPNGRYVRKYPIRPARRMGITVVEILRNLHVAPEKLRRQANPTHNSHLPNSRVPLAKGGAVVRKWLLPHLPHLPRRFAADVARSSPNLRCGSLRVTCMSCESQPFRLQHRKVRQFC